MENYDRYEIIEDSNKIKKLLLFRNNKLIDTLYLNDVIETYLLQWLDYSKL